jgi:hypothetical protein
MEEERERRENAFRQFSDLGLDVEWKVPVKIDDIPWGEMPSAYKNHSKYASQALTLIEVFKEVIHKGADHFMLFEDDIIFHPQILTHLPHITVPDDWKFIYVGGRNCGVKQYISRGLVKSTFVSDLHAVIIRSDMIDLLKQVLLDRNLTTHWADARIASLHKIYPTYLCRPNLAWQSVHSYERGSGEPFSNYNENGTVKRDQGD